MIMSTLRKKGLADRDFGNGRPMWQNIGYVVEVDPRERKVVKRHMTMGKLVHEDVHVTEDGKTVYITDDYSPGVFMKLEMEEPLDYDNGKLFAYKQSEDGESGEWLELPMDTTSLVNCRKIAVEMGATLIVRHEWVEEINGKLYISETGEDYMNWDASLALGGTVPKYIKDNFTDENGKMDDPFGRILEFDPSTNKMSSYLEGGMFSDSIGCFSNPDCNTSVVLGDKTYLVLSEDINWCDRGRVSKDAEEAKEFYNEIYFLDMSIENPTVEDLLRFAVAPKGSETTGVIFLPDGSMIVNIQHPSGSNPAPFNKSCTVLVEGFKK
jgi:secreted PhoX family phosphatase